MASTKDYLVFRDQIKNGDLVLFRGSGVLAKLIQLVDNAFYNHVGIVFIANKPLFIIDSNAPGVAPDFLSHRMLQYKNFCIVRPQIWQEKDIDNAVSQIMSKAEEKHIGYNFLLLLQIAVYGFLNVK